MEEDVSGGVTREKGLAVGGGGGGGVATWGKNRGGIRELGGEARGIRKERMPWGKNRGKGGEKE